MERGCLYARLDSSLSALTSSSPVRLRLRLLRHVMLSRLLRLRCSSMSATKRAKTVAGSSLVDDLDDGSQAPRIIRASPSRQQPASTSARSSSVSLISKAIDSGRKDEPDWSRISLDDLKEEVKRWGYRASAHREDLEEKAHAVWSALREEQHEEEDDDASSSAPAKAKSPPRPRSPPSATAPPAPGRYVFLDDDDGAARLLRGIQDDDQLHRRILLMEPIPFEEVWSVAQRCGLTEDEAVKARRGGANKLREDVRTWLDMRGIVWYQGDVGASRPRH